MGLNGTAEFTEEEKEALEAMKSLERIVSIVVPIFFSIVVLVGFFGNLLVVLVVAFNRQVRDCLLAKGPCQNVDLLQMRNTTNLLILNLAVTDILFIVFCVPFTAVSYALPHSWPFGQFW